MIDPAIAPDEMTLDELRVALAPLISAEAAFDGWSPVALARAAETLGIPADRARLVFPRGAVDMIDAWFAVVDEAMRQVCAAAAGAIAAMKMRERIRAAVWARIEVMCAAHLRGAAPGAGGARPAAERAARGAAGLAGGRCDVATGGRQRDRFQPLQQAHHPGCGLWLDAGSRG